MPHPFLSKLELILGIRFLLPVRGNSYWRDDCVNAVKLMFMTKKCLSRNSSQWSSLHRSNIIRQSAMTKKTRPDLMHTTKPLKFPHVRIVIFACVTWPWTHLITIISSFQSSITNKTGYNLNLILCSVTSCKSAVLSHAVLPMLDHDQCCCCTAVRVQ